jgi:hypothetical protein
MNSANRRVSEMTTRMIGFGGLTVEVFPAISIGGQKFSTLNDLAGKFDLFGSREAQEKGAAKAATEAKAALLIKILRQMKIIRETVLSGEGQQPGISQNFNMPASSSAESIIEAARAFVAAATPLKPFFLSREMPEDFLEVLTDDIQSYEDAVSNFNLHSANRVAARTMLKDVCTQVLVTRRELDPIVRNKFRDDPEKLAMWEMASHLERPATRGASATPGNGNQSPAGGNQPPEGGQA